MKVVEITGKKNSVSAPGYRQGLMSLPKSLDKARATTSTAAEYNIRLSMDMSRKLDLKTVTTVGITTAETGRNPKDLKL